MVMSRSTAVFSTALVALLLLSGCASTAQAPNRGDTSEVLGTWRYRTMSGSSLFDEGVIQITMQNGRLEGMLRDSRLGVAPLDVSYRGDNLQLRLEDIRIRGRVKDNEYVAFYERSMWDVTTPQRASRRGQDRINGSLAARRVEAKGYKAPDVPLGCDNLTEESSNRCE